MADKATRPTTEKKKSVATKKVTRPTAVSATKKVTRPTAVSATKKPRRVATKQEAPVAVVVTTPAPVSRHKSAFQAGTWIAILILAALVGFAFYLNTEKEKAGTEEATPTLEKAFIFTEADGVVSSIEVKPAEGGETVKIARNAENAWAVILPIETEANQGMAEAAATQLTALPISSQIEDGKSPAIFGLDKPSYVITIEFKDGKKRTLEVGDTTPTNSGYYVRVDEAKIMITDLSGIDALLQLGFFPPYLNTPAPTALPPTETPVVPTVEATSTPVP